MKVIYDDETNEICLISKNTSYTFIFNAVPLCEEHTIYWCADKKIPLPIATKLFQRWHQIDQSAEPEFIARALNDASNSDLFVDLIINTENTKVNIYSNGLFQCKAIKAHIWFNLKPCPYLSDISVKHNIIYDKVDYFIDGKLKGWLPIIRKEQS